MFVRRLFHCGNDHYLFHTFTTPKPARDLRVAVALTCSDSELSQFTVYKALGEGIKIQGTDLEGTPETGYTKLTLLEEIQI